MQQPSVGGFRLSPYQRQLWRLHPSDATSPYRSQVAVAISGPLDLDRLRHAVRDAAAEHEILRTAFEHVAGVNVPLQVMTTGAPQLRHQRGEEEAPGDAIARRAWLRSLLAADRERAVDLGEGPLRGSVVEWAADEHVLILSCIRSAWRNARLEVELRSSSAFLTHRLQRLAHAPRGARTIYAR